MRPIKITIATDPIAMATITIVLSLSSTGHWQTPFSTVTHVAFPGHCARTAGKYIKNIKFHDKKKYEAHIYSLFPSDPIREVCKLAGLPMPQADS